jgi:3-hydroxyacyl-[acyl-carrier-protein] dehydratase
MRWMWIDMVIAFEPGRRLTAVKNVSLAEDHLHDHFPDQPIMPASLMLEGMAQTAGVLVGSTREFREKVILAKIGSASIDEDVVPGQTIRYDAVIERVDDSGAGTRGTIARFDHRSGAWTDIGVTEIVFSHIDHNRSGLNFPAENFVFGENFRRLLNAAGLSAAMTAAGVAAP